VGVVAVVAMIGAARGRKESLAAQRVFHSSSASSPPRFEH
jgi:hypothetical protein